jgi:hypothetical protein
VKIPPTSSALNLAETMIIVVSVLIFVAVVAIIVSCRVVTRFFSKRKVMPHPMALPDATPAAQHAIQGGHTRSLVTPPDDDGGDVAWLVEETHGLVEENCDEAPGTHAATSRHRCGLSAAVAPSGNCGAASAFSATPAAPSDAEEASEMATTGRHQLSREQALEQAMIRAGYDRLEQAQAKLKEAREARQTQQLMAGEQHGLDTSQPSAADLLDDAPIDLDVPQALPSHDARSNGSTPPSSGRATSSFLVQPTSTQAAPAPAATPRERVQLFEEAEEAAEDAGGTGEPDKGAGLII